MDAKGYISKLETFGLVDGPGIRFVIFLQGCKMRCKYCHNPETWAMEGGQEWTAQDLFNRAYRYKNYWKDNGGITISGGEALLQMEFVTELFALAKEKGVQTCLDTSGNPFSRDPEYLEKFDKLMELTDIFMLDIKEMDGEKHKALTGHDNANILDLARYLSEHGKEMWIRHVLVPGLTDDEADLKALDAFVATLDSVTKVEILPYHTLALGKWMELGIPYPLDGVPTPTEEEVQRAEALLHIEK